METKAKEDLPNGLFIKACQTIIEETIFWRNDENPFKAKITPGDPRVTLVIGDNASGKSFLVDTARFMAGDLQEGAKTVSISIRERTGSGLDSMAGMRKAMMFGNESEQSTGAVSASMIKKGFSNVESRISEGAPTILVLDEPELGLAESFHYAVGTLIAQEVLTLSDQGKSNVAVVSHSRKVVQGLIDALGAQPSVVSMGEAGTLEQWLAAPQDKSVEELLQLKKTGHERYLKVSRLLDSLKNQKKADHGPKA